MATKDQKNHGTVTKRDTGIAQDSRRSINENNRNQANVNKPVISEQQPFTPRPEPTKKSGR